MPRSGLFDPDLTERLRLCLAEDIGTGDVTTEGIVPEGVNACAEVISKEPGIIAGTETAEALYHLLDPDVETHWERHDGDPAQAGEIVCRLKGSARALLTGERTFLNLLARFSGIATLTAKYVQAAAGCPVQIMDTRKTTPLWRLEEKAAVRAGGGVNHRMGLHDMILIKDNHIRMAGSVKEAIRRARPGMPAGMKMEVEAATVEQAVQAAEAGADIVMLDNMDPRTLARAVALIGDRVVTEGSGGISLDNVGEIAQTGVDRISLGALTQDAPALDFSTRLEPCEDT